MYKFVLNILSKLQFSFDWNLNFVNNSYEKSLENLLYKSDPLKGQNLSLAGFPIEIETQIRRLITYSLAILFYENS